MSLQDKLDNLQEKDVWTLLLFVLYKTKDVQEYSALSQLCYVLDRESIFKLCEYFGGTTITIPKIEELELLIYALLLYQYVDIEQLDIEAAFRKLSLKATKFRRNQIFALYNKIKGLLENYNFSGL